MSYWKQYIHSLFDFLNLAFTWIKPKKLNISVVFWKLIPVLLPANSCSSKCMGNQTSMPLYSIIIQYNYNQYNKFFVQFLSLSDRDKNFLNSIKQLSIVLFIYLFFYLSWGYLKSVLFYDYFIYWQWLLIAPFVEYSNHHFEIISYLISD